jgi:uncharacterized protein
MAIVSGVVATHVLDHQVVPEHVHVGTHLVTAAATVAAALATGASLADLGLSPDRVGAGLRRGALVSAAITGVVGLAALSPRTRHLFADQRVLDASAGDIARRSLVDIPIGTALTEELIFRGALLGLARRRMPTVPAVGATSVLFGLWHILPALTDRGHHPMTEARHPAVVAGASVAFTTAAGMLFSYERLRTGSIVAPVLTHTAINVSTYLMATWVARRAGSER